MLMTKDFVTPQLAMLEAVLDALRVGVALTTPAGNLLYINAAASRLIQSNAVLSTAGGRLSARERMTARRLASALAWIGQCGPTVPPDGKTLALRDHNGAALLLTIVPLMLNSGPCAYPPSAAVFMQDANLADSILEEAFGALYGLTRSELRVAVALRSGLTVQQAAACFGVSPDTVKTHLAHIFQKTGTSRQADLLILMARAARPICEADVLLERFRMRRFGPA